MIKLEKRPSLWPTFIRYSFSDNLFLPLSSLQFDPTSLSLLPRDRTVTAKYVQEQFERLIPQDLKADPIPPHSKDYTQQYNQTIDTLVQKIKSVEEETELLKQNEALLHTEEQRQQLEQDFDKKFEISFKKFINSEEKAISQEEDKAVDDLSLEMLKEFDEQEVTPEEDIAASPEQL